MAPRSISFTFGMGIRVRGSVRRREPCRHPADESVVSANAAAHRAVPTGTYYN